MRKRYNPYRKSDFNSMEMKELLNQAFKELRKAGFFARQNFLCCQSCGCAAIPDTEQKYIFYHNQDNATLMEGRGFYISYGTTKDEDQEKLKGWMEEAINIFTKNRIETEWDGSIATRILIKAIIPKPVEFKELAANI